MNPERVLHECATLSGLWWVWNSEPRVALRREGDFADPGLCCFDAFSVKKRTSICQTAALAALANFQLQPERDTIRAC